MPLQRYANRSWPGTATGRSSLHPRLTLVKFGPALGRSSPVQQAGVGYVDHVGTANPDGAIGGSQTLTLTANDSSPLRMQRYRDWFPSWFSIARGIQLNADSLSASAPWVYRRRTRQVDVSFSPVSEALWRYSACLSSSCSTARRIQLDTDLLSSSARRRTSSNVAGGNRTRRGSVILERRRGGPCGTWLSGRA